MPYQFRCSFHCPQPEKTTKILFSIICENYFICYLNGKEVARNKAPTTSEYIDLTTYKSNLQAGNNEILIELQEIELQQISSDSNDYMLFMAELVLV